MYTTQLTWFSPPHSPAGGFAPKPSRSPLLPLSLKIIICGRSYFYTAPCSQPTFWLFTWIVSPATGIDLQPQT